MLKVHQYRDPFTLGTHVTNFLDSFIQGKFVSGFLVMMPSLPKEVMSLTSCSLNLKKICHCFSCPTKTMAELLDHLSSLIPCSSYMKVHGVSCPIVPCNTLIKTHVTYPERSSKIFSLLPKAELWLNSLPPELNAGLTLELSFFIRKLLDFLSISLRQTCLISCLLHLWGNFLPNCLSP